MKFKKLLFSICLLAASAMSAFAQDTEFWFVAPDVLQSHTDRPVLFVFSNPNGTEATVTIRLRAYSMYETTQIITVPANGAKTVDFNGGGENITNVENPMANAGTAQTYGIHITSTQKILAYYMVNGGFQRDIFSLKGIHALGTDFATPFQGNTVSFPQNHTDVYPYYYAKARGNQIDIVATEATTLTITLPATVKCYNGSTEDDLDFTSTIDLDKGQTLKLAVKTIPASIPPTGLSGTRIHSTQPIAVTTTEDCIINGTAVDVAGDQIVPIDKVGTRYVIVRGYATDATTERIDFTALGEAATVRVYSTTGLAKLSPSQSLSLDAYETDFVTFPISTDVLFVEATKPVYCYQHSANGTEMGAAIIPSMYSISQNEISFYASNISGTGNHIFLVFREGTAGNFEFTYREPSTGVEIDPQITGPSVTATAGTIPFHTEFNATNWQYARVDIPDDAATKMVTVKNSNSVFSLGYFNYPGSTASYGYLSGFSGVDFAFNDTWRCPDCGSCTNPIFQTNYDMFNSIAWYLNDDPTPISFDDTPMNGNDPVVITQAGKYQIVVDMDSETFDTTIYVKDFIFDAKIASRLPKKPAKVTVPQLFTVNHGPSQQLPSGLPFAAYDASDPGPYNFYEWRPGDGGRVISGDENGATVVWDTPGNKVLSLYLKSDSIGDQSGGHSTCDTTLTYCVQVHPKNIGFFVDQNAPAEYEHNGASWETAFPTIQQALALASQGDYIWVADGDYSPRDSFPAAGVNDYANVYTGYYMCDYDSVKIFVGSYVMDYDSVQVYGGFSGYGKGSETNLSQRNFVDHPTILRGSDCSVVVVDGQTTYTNGQWGVSNAARWDGFTICDGQASDGGGVAFINGAAGTLSDNVIKHNTATSSGGGIYIAGPYSGSAPNGESLFHHLEVSGNRAVQGGGIYNGGSDATLLNLTVGGNLATDAGGGLYNAGGSPQTRNSILWGNRSGTEGKNDVANEYGSPSYTHSNIGDSRTEEDGWNEATGLDAGWNVSVSPFFARDGFDASGNMQEGDYRLMFSGGTTEGGGNRLLIVAPYPVSVLLGDPSPENTVYSDGFLHADLENKDRIMYDYVDMGAYEFIRPPIVSPIIQRRVRVPMHEGIHSAPPPGLHYVHSHQDFTLLLYPKEGYTLRNLRIETGSVEMDNRGGTEIRRQMDGPVTVTFHSVIEPLNIEYLDVERIVDVELGGVSVSAVEGLRAIWSEGGYLYVELPRGDRAVLKLYTLTGQLYRQQEITGGRTSLPLVPGMYIVSLNDGLRQKVIVK
ncbi:MAG: T9SS type A sorting domain-containing protein [Tannerella sp.]|jgi:hypothetical protein|nr:T9SS type A sorting domain-containing protein [Tannerella sp.]